MFEYVAIFVQIFITIFCLWYILSPTYKHFVQDWKNIDDNTDISVTESQTYFDDDNISSAINNDNNTKISNANNGINQIKTDEIMKMKSKISDEDSSSSSVDTDISRKSRILKQILKNIVRIGTKNLVLLKKQSNQFTGWHELTKLINDIRDVYK